MYLKMQCQSKRSEVYVEKIGWIMVPKDICILIFGTCIVTIDGIADIIKFRIVLWKIILD